MKKISMLLIISACCMTTLAHALSVSVGANGWYNWWKPAWSSGSVIFREVYPKVTNSKIILPEFNTESSFLYGPVISISFLDNFSLSTVLMLSRFNYSTNGIGGFVDLSGMSSPGAIYLVLERSARRWDSDTALTYNLSAVFFVFIGFKAQVYSYIENAFINDNLIKYESTVMNFGPGLGFGINYRIIGDLYCNGAVSGIVLRGIETGKFKGSATTNEIFNFRNGYYLSYGMTSSLSLAYRIQPINTTISLGFRYQFLYYYQSDRETGYIKFNGKSDRYYGITLSAVYSFNL